MKIEPIKFTGVDGNEYTLEFNREAVKRSERLGLQIDEFYKELMTNTEILFYCSFIKNHNLTKEETDKILYEDFGGLEGEEITTLIGLYMETLNSLINVDSKNARRVTIHK